MNIITTFKESFPLLLKGLGMTVEMTLISLFFAFILGLVSCMMYLSSSKILNWLSKIYIWIIRGTPLMVQGFFIYFSIPQLIQYCGYKSFRLTVLVASVITLSLNAGAYLSELFRGGIQAIDKGQIEAARSLGLSHAKTMRKVVLPQAFKICIPSLVNQFIITLKDTSILSAISLGEICYQAKIYIGRTMNSFATWLLVGLMYLAIVSALMVLSGYIERRLNVGHKGESKKPA